jgi:MoaA/NifB/PqqE/SkfB family radical SAM enzyme
MVINWQQLLKTAYLLKRRLRPDYNSKTGQSLLDGPRMIQIQTIDACNGSCACCPYVGGDNKKLTRSMDWHLYIKLVDELSRVDSLREFVLMLQNEPLLDENLVKRVRQARMKLKKPIRIYIVTNGTLLSSSVVKELFDAGLDHVEVSLDALTEDTYNRVRAGLEFNRVLENTHMLIAQGGMKKVIVRFLIQKSNAHELKAFNAYWVKNGATVKFQDMTNRAGTLRYYMSLRPELPPDLYARIEKMVMGNQPCISGPFDRLNVLSDGRALACCQDWRHDFILGDISRQSLTEIWTGSEAAFFRNILWHGQFGKSTICATCSNRMVFPGRTVTKFP